MLGTELGEWMGHNLQGVKEVSQDYWLLMLQVRENGTVKMCQIVLDLAFLGLFWGFLERKQILQERWKIIFEFAEFEWSKKTDIKIFTMLIIQTIDYNQMSKSLDWCHLDYDPHSNYPWGLNSPHIRLLRCMPRLKPKGMREREGHLEGPLAVFRRSLPVYSVVSNQMKFTLIKYVQFHCIVLPGEGIRI